MSASFGGATNYHGPKEKHASLISNCKDVINDNLTYDRAKANTGLLGGNCSQAFGRVSNYLQVCQFGCSKWPCDHLIKAWPCPVKCGLQWPCQHILFKSCSPCTSVPIQNYICGATGESCRARVPTPEEVAKNTSPGIGTRMLSTTKLLYPQLVDQRCNDLVYGQQCETADYPNNKLLLGTRTDKYTGQCFQILADPLPGPTTERNQRQASTINRPHPMLMMYQGTYETPMGKYSRKKEATELSILTDPCNSVKPQRFYETGPNVFGDELYKESTRSLRQNMVKRELYHNKNDMLPEVPQLGRERPFGYIGSTPMYRVLPPLPVTQNLDLTRPRDVGITEVPTQCQPSSVQSQMRLYGSLTENKEIGNYDTTPIKKLLSYNWLTVAREYTPTANQQNNQVLLNLNSTTNKNNNDQVIQRSAPVTNVDHGLVIVNTNANANSKNGKTVFENNIFGFDNSSLAQLSPVVTNNNINSVNNKGLWLGNTDQIINSNIIMPVSNSDNAHISAMNEQKRQNVQINPIEHNTTLDSAVYIDDKLNIINPISIATAKTNTINFADRANTQLFNSNIISTPTLIINAAPDSLVHTDNRLIDTSNIFSPQNKYIMENNVFVPSVTSSHKKKQDCAISQLNGYSITSGAYAQNLDSSTEKTKSLGGLDSVPMQSVPIGPSALYRHSDVSLGTQRKDQQRSSTNAIAMRLGF